jgi:catechol 2,3-dioxygenase-like lactoylglutathione lyase family enzyme
MSQVLGPIDHVYYWVSDMDRAAKFYEEILGLSMGRREGSNWAELDGGTIRLALHGAIEGHAQDPGGATVSFSVTDLDAARRELESRGVEFDHVGEVGEEARYATFRDPDGNTLQIIEHAEKGES